MLSNFKSNFLISILVKIMIEILTSIHEYRPGRHWTYTMHYFEQYQ